MVKLGIFSIFLKFIFLLTTYLLMLLNVVAQQGQELVGDIERAFGQTCPEVEILRGFLILERDVADDAEADEGHPIDVAGLCNGTAFHIDSLGMGEMPEYRLHLLLGIDKPFAAGYLTSMYGATGNADGLLHQSTGSEE